jgi:hypothetical protein
MVGAIKVMRLTRFPSAFFSGENQSFSSAAKSSRQPSLFS